MGAGQEGAGSSAEAAGRASSSTLCPSQHSPGPLTVLAVHGHQVWPARGGDGHKAQRSGRPLQLHLTAAVQRLHPHAPQRSRQPLVGGGSLVEQLQGRVGEQQLQPLLAGGLQHARQHRQALRSEAGDDDVAQAGRRPRRLQLAGKVDVKHLAGHVDQRLACPRAVLHAAAGQGASRRRVGVGGCGWRQAEEFCCLRPASKPAHRRWGAQARQAPACQPAAPSPPPPTLSRYALVVVPWRWLYSTSGSRSLHDTRTTSTRLLTGSTAMSAAYLVSGGACRAWRGAGCQGG